MHRGSGKRRVEVVDPSLHPCEALFEDRAVLEEHLLSNARIAGVDHLPNRLERHVELTQPANDDRIGELADRIGPVSRRGVHLVRNE